MPTLAPDSVITEILDEAGVRMMKTVDAELVAKTVLWNTTYPS